MSNDTMKPIELCEDLRVNDYDDNQYTVEARTVAQGGKNAGKVTWTPVAYVGGVKSLPTIAKRVYADHFARIEQKGAQDRFDAAGFWDVLVNLPAKNGKRGPSK